MDGYKKISEPSTKVVHSPKLLEKKQLSSLINKLTITPCLSNFRKGLHSHARAGAKTGLAVCLTGTRAKTSLLQLKYFWGQQQKSCVFVHPPCI